MTVLRGDSSDEAISLDAGKVLFHVGAAANVAPVPQVTLSPYQTALTRLPQPGPMRQRHSLGRVAEVRALLQDRRKVELDAHRRSHRGGVQFAVGDEALLDTEDSRSAALLALDGPLQGPRAYRGPYYVIITNYQLLHWLFGPLHAYHSYSG